MTKLTAGVVKKVPVPGVAYSNQEFSAGLEVELPDDASAGEVQQRLRDMYALIGETVESEIAAATEAARSNQRDQQGWQGRNQQNGGDGRRDDWRNRQNTKGGGGHRSGYQRDNGAQQSGGRWQRNGNNGGGGRWQRGGNNGGGRNGAASDAQVNAIYNIAKHQGIEERDILERVEDQFGVRRVEELNVKQASELIDSLKAA